MLTKPSFLRKNKPNAVMPSRMVEKKFSTTPMTVHVDNLVGSGEPSGRWALNVAMRWPIGFHPSRTGPPQLH